MNVFKTFKFIICTRHLNAYKPTGAVRYCTRALLNSCEATSNNLHFRNMDYNARVAVCQFTAKNDKEQNFMVCKHLIERASEDGAKMVFLPEACDYIGESKEEIVNLSEPLDGPLICRYRELAKAQKVWLSLGGIHEKANNGKVHNSHVLINEMGELVAVYRKLHLFDVEIPEKQVCIKESDFVEKGREIVRPVPTPAGKLGLAICYDMRFAELSVALRRLGAEVLTYPSAFTFATGAVHWEVLLRSRAIENQCYVIAAAQYGSHNKKRTSWGHAMVIDPSGNVVAQCSEGTGFVMANIDLSLIEDIRKSMPVDKQKRLDIYPELLPLAPVAPGTGSYQEQYQFGQVSIPETHIFYKTDSTMAFVNKRCVVPGHVLVAPLRPALRLQDLTPSEVADLFLVVQRVQQVMEQMHGCSSTTIAVQDGPDAGRTINHLHVHILPRKQKDFLNNDDIYHELQKHDKDETKPWRGLEEMGSEASVLRERFQ
ncbi:hypothetical protein LSTR_LSTR013248 [Laodelphax striatellus]|uniref:Nitrilase and fragile histidine triad fusion protein NitFhit n=1 Tax=Laodelphax striatellus TaxID=195883 RepID=A0A482WM00_LAOST|nr:hypothetical protein LSTR_LSTR013248 [Laodelphax striatellus]